MRISPNCRQSKEWSQKIHQALPSRNNQYKYKDIPDLSTKYAPVLHTNLCPTLIHRTITIIIHCTTHQHQGAWGANATQDLVLSQVLLPNSSSSMCYWRLGGRGMDWNLEILGIILLDSGFYLNVLFWLNFLTPLNGWGSCWLPLGEYRHPGSPLGL